MFSSKNLSAKHIYMWPILKTIVINILQNKQVGVALKRNSQHFLWWKIKITKVSSWPLRVYFICPWKNFIQCTFQNDLLCVIVTVFNIVQYWTTVLITTLPVCFSSIMCFYLPPEAKNVLIGLGKLELSFISDTFQKNGRKPGLICTLPVQKNNSSVWDLTLEMDLCTVNYLFTNSNTRTSYFVLLLPFY